MAPFARRPHRRRLAASPAALGRDRTRRLAEAIAPSQDPCERDAERLSDRILRWTAPDGPVAAGRRPRPRQPREGSPGRGDLDAVLGVGTPLDAGSRRFFEPRFGHDFGHVRVHSDARAADAAAGVSARAFTRGADVVFASGAYDPGSRAGRRLMAHELVHVAQGAASGYRGVSAAPNTIYRAPDTPAADTPSFAGVGNQAGIEGALRAAQALETLVSGPAVARALATIPITDADQKATVIRHVLEAPGALRAIAGRGHVRSLSPEEFSTGVSQLGFPSAADAFADADRDFLYITPHGTPSRFTMGHEISHIQTGAVRADGADPDLSLALGNLNMEIRAAFVDYALVQLNTMQGELAGGAAEDEAVAGFTRRYANVFDYMANHGSVSKTLGELAGVVANRRAVPSVPTNETELKKAVAQGYVAGSDLPAIFSTERNPFNDFEDNAP